MLAKVKGMGAIIMIRRGLTAAVLLSVVLLTPVASRGEITKYAEQAEGGLQLRWWPRLPLPEGWAQDAGATRDNGCNALAPVNETFADAKAVIYGCAFYKPRMQGVRSLRAFIANDQATFRQGDPRLRLDHLADMTTAGGARLTLYELTPGSGANWEVVAYGEEAGEPGSAPEESFFLTFALSARSQAARDAALPAFRDMLRAYR
jgi:hypothetical protein